MIDFELDPDGDIVVSRAGVATDSTQVSPIIAALFTDGRHSGQRGYWLSLPMSTLWRTEQRRNEDSATSEAEAAAQAAMAMLIEKQIFTEATAVATRVNGETFITIGVTTKEKVSVSKQFKL